MPHLVVNRLRSFSRPPAPGELRKRDAWCALLIEGFDIFAGVIFFVGSVCFLPDFAHNLNVFLAGCALFVLGGVIYCGICGFALMECIGSRGFATFEACENALYLFGSVVFVAGTVMYWPPEAHHKGMDWLVNNISLGVYFNLFTPEFEGTLLFILGSLLFLFAAFVNGLDQRNFAGSDGKLLGTTTALYMGGSVLFVLGSVAFLPDIGFNEHVLTVGASCFIVGSVLYIAGSTICLFVTARELRDPARAPLWAKAP